MGRTQPFPGRGGNPVTAFFRGLYTEMAFSKESLRLNGQGLLFGLGGGAAGGGPGGLFDRLLAWADVLRNGTAWASLLLPLAGLVVVWMYRRGGIKNRQGGDRPDHPGCPGGSSRSPACWPRWCSAPQCSPMPWGALPAGGGPPADGGIPGRAGA